MNSIRPLLQASAIPLCIGLGFAHPLPAGAPVASFPGLRAPMLAPFGLLVPLVSAGCLLHTLFEGRRPKLARAVERAGKLLALCIAAVLLARHLP